MSKWIVYSKDGLTERCEVRKLEYSGSFMNERTVTATFEHYEEVGFEVFDYIVYRNEQFELESVPTVKKTSSHSYSYELRFVSHKYELERCQMRDIVPNDNGVVYPTPLSFSFTGDVKYLAERIEACLDDLYGEGVWTISVAEGTESDEKNITISDQSCWNALSLVNTEYGLNFYIKGRTITIGGTQSVVAHTFEYGKGNGLYEIERVADSDTAIVTKLRAFGSTRNLDASYPKRPYWTDSVLEATFALTPLRLMLPDFKTDGKTDYVLADDAVIEEYGIREASVTYEDIYPSITGATNSSGQAIDEIKSVDAVDDSASTFVVYLHDLGFSLEEHLTADEAQISMKSGVMQGYTFNISKIEVQEDGSNKLTLGRITTDSSDTSSYNIPNSDWMMAAGDKFVLLNILMPQEYIRDAENRLLARAKEYLAEYGKTNFSYNIGLHDKFLIDNPTLYDAIVEGSKLTIHDGQLGINEAVVIQSLTITEDAESNILPQVKVTLNNKPSASTLERIQGQINEIQNATSGSFSSQSELYKQYQRKLNRTFFDRMFVAVDAEGKEIASTDITTDIAYIKARYHFATVGGVTMFIQDQWTDLPQIVDAIPFDNTTIWYNTEKKVVEVIGGGGGEGATTLGALVNVGTWANEEPTEDRIMVQKAGANTWSSLLLSEVGSASFENVSESGSGNAYTSFYVSSDGKSLTLQKGESFAMASELDDKWTTDYTKISNWDEAYGWGDHSSAGYAHEADLSDYVTIRGDEEIIGAKNFTGGLSVNGCEIVYTGEYWKLTGDLLVTGGVTMFANEGTYTPTTIMDGVSVDWSTIIKDDNGRLALNPDLSIGGGGTEGTTTYPLAIVVNGEGIASFNGSKAVTAEITMPTKTSELENDSDFATNEYVNQTFVTIGGNPQVITGEKDFTGGLKVNGCPIVYDSENGYWMFTGDMLVTGGVTMFTNEGTYTPTTIMDGVNVDGETIIKDSFGRLAVNPDISLGGGSIEYPLNWSGFAEGSWDGSASATIRIPSALGELDNDVAYVKASEVTANIKLDSDTLELDSNGNLTVTGGAGGVEIVSSVPSDYDSNTLYVIVG